MTSLFAPARPRIRLAAVLFATAATVPALLGATTPAPFTVDKSPWLAPGHAPGATVPGTTVPGAAAVPGAAEPGPAAPGSAGRPNVHHLAPGASVQAAVDAARPGDVVELAAGTFPGSVTLATDGVTLRGQGNRTVLVPDPADRSACAAAGNGLCVTGVADDRGMPVRPVSGAVVESLAVAGFPKSGIAAAVTDRLTVHEVSSHDNGLQGISVEMSTRTVLTDNEARDNGQAGIFVANWFDRKGGALETRGTQVAGNRLTDNRIGLQLRRVRDLTAIGNLAYGNCGGIFVVGDDGVPRAGSLTVSDNVVRANNRYCAPNPRLDAVQGTGILLTGTEDVVVSDNQVADHSGTSPMSGGIVLYPSVVGAPNARAVITGNMLSDNQPADIADLDQDTGSSFTNNACRTSQPAGHC
ncbi:nitrous oxide reductase family maturation protein NosD [Kitasatospora sp. NPDC059795]|uniref:right-handed parallel beta-helix repeat-containing protein n=1 Tax=Kitasatospora sp. NPDC059795 TaxID=3346949 RepID=UPI00364980B3